MRVHSCETIENIKNLRRVGRSIPEIMILSGLSKTTIWHHVHSIPLSAAKKRRITSNQGGSTKRYEDALARANDHSLVLLASNHKNLCAAVGMLYWAEGSKRELVFTNTDVSMIMIYLNFLRKVLMVKESDIHLLIRISDPIKPKQALQFWSRNTKTKSTQISFNHDNVQNRTKSKYGICRVNVKKNSYYLKVIHCIIDVVKKDMLP